MRDGTAYAALLTEIRAAIETAKKTENIKPYAEKLAF
jgi:hypothetical protein